MGEVHVRDRNTTIFFQKAYLSSLHVNKDGQIYASVALLKDKMFSASRGLCPDPELYPGPRSAPPQTTIIGDYRYRLALRACHHEPPLLWGSLCLCDELQSSDPWDPRPWDNDAKTCTAAGVHH